MKASTRFSVDYLCEDLFDYGKNHVLLYGKPEDTSAVLKAIFEKAGKMDEFRCTYHDASLINKPMDFYEPILRLKYGDEYEEIVKNPWFMGLADRTGLSGVFRFASLCAQEEDSENPQHRKKPLIFIEGIEELFFKFDYAHLDEEGIKRVLGYTLEAPIERGFGSCLRAYLHQEPKGIFYGTVRDEESIAYQTMLGNGHYMFFNGNFLNHDVES